MTRLADYAMLLAVAFAAGVIVATSWEDVSLWICQPNAQPSNIWTAR